MASSDSNGGEPPSSSSPPAEELPADAVKLKDEGNMFFKNSHFKEAIEKYTQAIELCPDQKAKVLSAWYANRALCYLRTEAYGSAAADARKAIELDNRNPKAYYRLGSAHVALGKYKEGLQVFTIVCKMCPNDKDAKTKLEHCQKEVKRAAFEAAIATEATMLPSEKCDPSQVKVEDSYKGPRWDTTPEGQNFAEHWQSTHSLENYDGKTGIGGITKQFVEDAVELMKNQGKIHKKYVLKLLLAAKFLLKPLPSLVQISVFPGKKITVCGDVHGQFYDLLNIFELAGRPSRENPFLFNGDFVDRGSFSVEVILTLLMYKCLDPLSVHLLRGNHETKNMNKIYGFEGEVKHKYDMVVMDLFTEIFRYLPLSATLNKKVIIMHGGLFQKDGVLLEDIAKIPRFCEPPDTGLFSDILWSDPQPFEGRGPSKRGVGQSFGPDVTKGFLDDNKLELLVRSHEVRDDGYLVEHDGKLITVFSAPNYCDQMGNKGAYIVFTGHENNAITYDCVNFVAVPHPQVPPMAFAGNIFGL